MPDEIMNPEVPLGPGPQGVEVAAEAKPKNRKGLLIALAALAALAVVAAIAVSLVLFVFNGVKDGIEVRVTPTEQTTTGSTTTETPAAAGPADAVANDEVFTFRDIFKPLAGAAASDAAADATDETSSTLDTSEYSADTLYLVNILSDGVTQWALMVWDQKEYQLAEGEAIPDTPWKLLDIRTDDVIMLYGDQQVVLSVGQGISK